MQNPQYSTHHIYQHVQSLVNKLLNDLTIDSGDLATKDTTAYSQQLLNNLYGDITAKLNELEKYAEWNTFTIALYGETNAGKSTIIETLRILLGEATKKQQQAKFKQWQLDAGITVDTVEQTRQLILDTEKQIETIDAAWNIEQTELKQMLIQCETSHNLAQQVWIDLKKSVSLLQRFIWLFKTSPQAKAANSTNDAFSSAKSALTQQTASHLESRNQLVTRVNEIEKNYLHLISAIKLAEPFADGGIIGNGQSDFTLDTQCYSFDVDGCQFNLLDVPGIEGKESKVSEAIWQAVHKAHAVFYITSKASAPQKGDANNPGTLEKIKQHLDDQSEVWTIFNKRIQNPIQLDKNQLVSDGELESLRDLDAKMTQYLGDNYQQCLMLSAYPAYLAVASCLLPDSRDRMVQNKFLAQYSAQQIIVKSNIAVLTKMFTKELVEEFKIKIMRSNHNKAKKVVDATRDNVMVLRKEKYSPLLKKLRLELTATNAEFTTSIETLRVKLNNNMHALIREFESSVRNATYSQIDDDISNDEVKSFLKRQIEQSQQTLIDQLPSMVNKETNLFERKLNDIINRFESHTNELMTSFNNIESTNIDLDINIKNGINIWGVLGAMGGGAILLFNPMGWVLLAISASSLVFQVYKAVRSFFSNTYKRAQQKESVDDNIYKIADQLTVRIENNLAEVIKDVDRSVERVSDVMSNSVEKIAVINKKLQQAQKELNDLCTQLEY
tara:strand:- start:2866 stop:5043 length:2178 start_codon:yes stop_codon:yes gene_type:complete